MDMIKVGVLGATGYAGIETVRLLLRRSDVKIERVVSKSFAGKKLDEIYPNFFGAFDIICSDLDVDDIAESCDLVFTALPHGASKTIIPELYERGLKIIDLSGDFRYDDPKVYEAWYGEPHSAPELLKEAVYGLCELHRGEIARSRLIGNPGCYTTCSILGLAPAVKAGILDNTSIIIDAKSGVTGAGRGTSIPNLYSEVNESVKAYKIATHRHTSEIEQELSKLAGEEIKLSFTPHLVPLQRGIFSTEYANLKKDVSADELYKIYCEFYEGEEFVKVYEPGRLPELKHVRGSNYAGIGFVIDERLKRLIVVSCIDNLVKGAAGQAIQNMNIICGFDENTGLTDIGMYL